MGPAGPNAEKSTHETVMGLQDALTDIPALADHPNSTQLIEIVTGETDVSSAGFPYISSRSFRLLAQEVPHLYRDGAAILQWLAILEGKSARLANVRQPAREGMGRAIKVLRTVVYTAGVTATPDLWILKHVLSAHKQLGILEWLGSEKILDPELYARENGMDKAQLTTDLHFLHSRGYLRKEGGEFVIAKTPGIADALRSATAIPSEYRGNLVPTLTEWFSASSIPGTDLNTWLEITVDHKPTGSWVASHFQIELAYRLLPVVLSLRVLEITPQLKRGERLSDHISNLLQSTEAGTWVHRGENVAASQDANRKTFSIANNKLDQFCAEHGFDYTVFIEHAVGRGEAIRQRFERDGEESALQDEGLIRTAWNTYHAGFRYVHEMSGQGLRPAIEREGGGSRWSWRKCAELGGYRVLDEYGYRSRTIYPYKLPRHMNPAISVTYFCVPDELVRKLGI